MPTVPTSFIPQVAPQGAGDIGDFAAPGIAPAENLAAPQVARFGQQLTQTGMAAFRLGSAIQDGIDEAKTKEADVAAGRGMQAVADKYSSMIGKDAEVNYDAMQSELSQAGQSAMGMLDNDVQRRMLSPILARNMGIFQSRMGQHRVQQLRVYQTNEATARAEWSADQAIQAYSQRGLKDAEGRQVGMIQYFATADTAIDEIRKAGQLMGYAPDSAQMKQLEQKVYDRMAVGIVNGLMAEKNYAGASEFLSDSTTVESLDGKTRQALADSVDANRQRSVVGELASSIKNMGLLVSKSDPDTYSQQKDGPVEPPTTLREALVLTDQIADDQTRKFVQAELRTQFAQDDALIEQEYNINVENILQFLAVPGNTAADIPADQFGRLRPVDRQKIMAGQKSRKDLLVQEEIAINPSKYATVDAVDKIRMDISPQLYIKLRERLNQPEKIIEATVDANMLNTTLYDNGFADLVNPSNGNASATERKIRLQNAVNLRVEAEQKNLGRKMSDKEKQGIIDRAIIEMGTSVQEDAGWFWFDKTEQLPLSMMTPAQRAGVTNRFLQIGDTKIPGGVYEAIYADLASTGRVPTAKQVLEYYERTRKPE
jgi:hypothetical protein